MNPDDADALIASLGRQQELLLPAAQELDRAAASPPRIDPDDWGGVAAEAHRDAARALRRALEDAAAAVADTAASFGSATAVLGG